ncbi:MAG TPA: hypothetical protein PLF75_09700 [Bacteroidales bacterium]|nr:hypothetical protein [Bacteroidales bacterium]
MSAIVKKTGWLIADFALLIVAFPAKCQPVWVRDELFFNYFSYFIQFFIPQFY